MNAFRIESSSNNFLAMPLGVNSPISFYSVAFFLISSAFSGVLSGLPLEVFKDRANYLIYADQSFLILLGNFSKGVLSTLANEPIWLLINAGLATLFPPGVVLRLIIFIPAFLTAWFILRCQPKQIIWLLLFLFLPQVVNNNIVHLRQGFAIAVFLSGWYSNNKTIRWMLLGSTPFIHSSFFFVMAIYFLTKFMKKLCFAADLRSLTYLVFAFVTCVSLGKIALLVGARQGVEYVLSSSADISGLGFLFWMFILVLMVFQDKFFWCRYSFEIGGLLFYLVSYWFIPVSARIFESMLLLILVAGLNMTSWRRQVFLLAVISYGCLSYALRINQPWYGFGL